MNNRKAPPPPPPRSSSNKSKSSSNALRSPPPPPPLPAPSASATKIIPPSKRSAPSIKHESEPPSKYASSSSSNRLASAPTRSAPSPPPPPSSSRTPSSSPTRSDGGGGGASASSARSRSKSSSRSTLTEALLGTSTGKEEQRKKGPVSVPIGAADVASKYDILEQIGSGTYGYVYRGKVRGTDRFVALKKIKTDDPRPEPQRDGFPITALREIKLLSCMSHENVIKLEEIVTAVEDKEGVPSAIYMVFEYCDGDLLDLLKGVRDYKVRLTEDHLRSFTRQLLEGIHYIHTNRILHRDIKAANILITRDCRLKIGDWGLGRSWLSDEKKARYTDNVVTLWYRAPELLMGVANYTTAIDIWSIGCLIAELFLIRTLFQGRDELDQMNRIFDICGTPSVENWPDLDQSCPGFATRGPPKARSRRLLKELSVTNCGGGSEGADLVDKLLILDPAQRYTAEQALEHDYLWIEEYKDPRGLPPLFTHQQKIRSYK